MTSCARAGGAVPAERSRRKQRWRSGPSGAVPAGRSQRKQSGSAAAPVCGRPRSGSIDGLWLCVGSISAASPATAGRWNEPFRVRPMSMMAARATWPPSSARSVRRATPPYAGSPASSTAWTSTSCGFPRRRSRPPSAACPTDLQDALDVAHDRILAYHAHESGDSSAEDFESGGIEVRHLVRPVARAGCYAPGGRARYPSTVLMCAVPAQVAGVDEIVLCVPPGPGGPHRRCHVGGCRRSRCGRGVPGGWGPGHRGHGLRDGVDRRRRCHRRPRQPLCGRGQAPGVGSGGRGVRLRRAVGSGGDRRSRDTSRAGGHRSRRPGRARTRWTGLVADVVGGGGRGSGGPCGPHGQCVAPAGGSRGHPRCGWVRGAGRRPRAGMRGGQHRGSRAPGDTRRPSQIGAAVDLVRRGCLPRARARRPASATIWPGPTTFCPPTGRPGSPARSGWTTSGATSTPSPSARRPSRSSALTW